MRLGHAAALSGFVVLLSSCSGVPRYVPPAEHPPPPLVVRLWVEDHPRLPKADALAGCQVWAPVGVTCALAEDRELADIRVRGLDGPCVRNEDGRRTLATAYSDGHRVEFNTLCFMDGRRFDAHMFRAVMGHEIGHELGIWTHVPEECDDGAARHPGGGRVCGAAIMNPYYDDDVHFMTPIDALAFDLRDLSYAAVEVVHGPDGPRAADEPSCVYRTLPKR